MIPLFDVSMRRCRNECIGLVLACLAGGAAAAAPPVSVAGVFPGKAVLVIDGRSPRTMAVGERSPDGVRVVSIDGEAVTIEFDGRRERLGVGQHAVSVGAGGAPGGAVVTLQADGAGHFVTEGSVNGAPVRFLVDTGASAVSLGRGDALRAGIPYTRGEAISSQTANGVVRVWRVKLDEVRVGAVTLRNVEGVVHEQNLPFALLGMSFLNRMEMRRDGGALSLRQRY